MLAEMGVSAKVAGMVVECPAPGQEGTTGTLADMVGLSEDNPRLAAAVTEMVDDAVAEGADPSKAVERGMKPFAKRDETGEIVREDMTAFESESGSAQKKTPNNP
jgi:hypothetical protein